MIRYLKTMASAIYNDFGYILLLCFIILQSGRFSKVKRAGIKTALVFWPAAVLYHAISVSANADIPSAPV